MKVILIFTILISWGIVQGQSNDFDKLISKYGKEGTEIDSVQLRKYFDVDLHPDIAPSGYADKIILRKPNMIGLTCKVICTAGGGCESSKLRIFDYEGNVLGKLKDFEHFFADCSDQNEKYCEYISDSILIVVDKVKAQKDCDTDSLVKLEISIETYRIKNNGEVIKLDRKQIDTRREYFFTSIKLLSDSDLKDKSKIDLATMRNEIYAAHGYIFKTDKWRNYFKTQSWYAPRFDNVNNDLTLIEKENIKLIQKHEKH
ncbi:YARHG domain-containing protein [Croceimicrobium hydrocarbonivorans]|uniref:YARHG domain-containing protein n=1 Tax=Croceimicrobium hydrocarbonivorans TaxID=2761580 RepID=A0A7H0VHD3_9FLAO|nr:YARHG domain-containing protein [Croceimicrobium hydrocarbonivorans]QNR25131.1 YARHG domain-containing protein [Croceimicrobium hydrocarbonivorans]